MSATHEYFSQKSLGLLFFFPLTPPPPKKKKGTPPPRKKRKKKNKGTPSKRSNRITITIQKFKKESRRSHIAFYKPTPWLPCLAWPQPRLPWSCGPPGRRSGDCHRSPRACPPPPPGFSVGRGSFNVRVAVICWFVWCWLSVFLDAKAAFCKAAPKSGGHKLNPDLSHCSLVQETWNPRMQQLPNPTHGMHQALEPRRVV